MIELQTNIAVTAIESLEWNWLNHDIPLWVTLLFAFTKPYMWSSKLSGVVGSVIGQAEPRTTQSESNESK